MSGGIEKALGLIRNLPRVSLGNVKPLPGFKTKKKNRKGRHGGRKRGMGNKGAGQRGSLPRVGFEGGNTPFYLLIPKEPYYQGHHLRRQYPPLSMLQLQRAIDMGAIDPEEPIDLTSLCNSKFIHIDAHQFHSGVQLTDEGADIFDAKINLEIQAASEVAIAAIEKNGGVITTKYYDKASVSAMSDPIRFFKKGVPIPKVKLPPQDAFEFYSDPENRGYLAELSKIHEARFALAQKYGYILPDITKDASCALLAMRKHQRQLWYGLEAGWVVNLKDKSILKPTNEQLQEYYSS